MQLPETLLPLEIRLKVQTYIRTPTAELIHEAMKPFLKMKLETMRHCYDNITNTSDVNKALKFIDDSFTFYGYMLKDEEILAWADGMDDEPREFPNSTAGMTIPVLLDDISSDTLSNYSDSEFIYNDI